MIKSLQKRISTLFMFLLTIIWLVILLLFVNNSYRNNLSDLQQTVRAALHYTTWDAFVISNGQTSPSELDHISYCLFSIDESNEMDIMFDTFSDVSDSYLLKQGKALISNSKKYVFIRRYVSVNHLRAKKRTILCFNAQRNTCFKSNTSDCLSLFYSGNSRYYCIYHFLQSTFPLDGKTD